MLIKTLCQGYLLEFPELESSKCLRSAEASNAKTTTCCTYALKRQRFLAQVRSQRDTSLLNSLPELDKNVYARTGCSC